MKEIEINKIELPDIEVEETTDEEAREYIKNVFKPSLEQYEEVSIVGVRDLSLHYVVYYKNDYFEKIVTKGSYYKDFDKIHLDLEHVRKLREDIRNILENDVKDFYYTVEDMDDFKRKMVEKVEPKGLINKLYEKYTIEQFESKIRDYKREVRKREDNSNG